MPRLRSKSFALSSPPSDFVYTIAEYLLTKSDKDIKENVQKVMRTQVHAENIMASSMIEMTQKYKSDANFIQNKRCGDKQVYMEFELGKGQYYAELKKIVEKK